MKEEPQKEHQWLQRLVGEWAWEMEASMGPDQPPHKSQGTDSVRSIGGLWVQCEGRWTMPDGGASTTIMTLGYDPARKRYVGTFIGSMMTHLWIYDGALNAAGDTLTLDAEGPSFASPGKTAKYKDEIQFESDDHRLLKSHALGDDGKWNQFMTAHYRRVR